MEVELQVDDFEYTACSFNRDIVCSYHFQRIYGRTLSIFPTISFFAVFAGKAHASEVWIYNYWFYRRICVVPVLGRFLGGHGRKEVLKKLCSALNTWTTDFIVWTGMRRGAHRGR